MDKKDAGMDKKDRKKLLLIIMHIVIISGLAVLIVFLALPSDDGQKEVAVTEQITEEPQPLAGETTNTVAPEPTATETVVPTSTAVAPSQTADTGTSPTPTASATATGTPRPTTATTPKPTTAPTPTPTTAPTTAPTPTQMPTPTTTTAPTPTPTQTTEPTPTPEFTYSVTNKDGVAPAGYTFVFVTVTPDGSYTVKYSGTTMDKSSGKYYLMVEKLESGNYRSNVSVTKS